MIGNRIHSAQSFPNVVKAECNRKDEVSLSGISGGRMINVNSSFQTAINYVWVKAIAIVLEMTDNEMTVLTK